MKNKIEIYRTTDNQTEVKVQFDENTVWLNQAQMADLFERDRTVISRHIGNIFKEGELDKEVVCAKFAHLAALTLFIANSKPEEAEIVKRLTISILNRNK